MTSPKTVLQVRNSVLYGGVETTMLGWLDNIDTRRFSCPVALFKNARDTETAFKSPLVSHGHTVHELPWAPGKSIPKAINHLADLIRETNAVLLHTHDWRSDIIGYYAARKAGIPIMTTIYVWFRKPLKILLYELLDTLHIRRFDMVTAVCEATRKQTISRGVNARRTQVVISGMDHRRDPGPVDKLAVRKRFGIQPDEIAFVYTARFYPEKAHGNLVEAFAQSLKNHRHKKLLLLGTGPLEASMRAKIKTLGIADHVIMPGFVDDVPVVLKAMDVMVHPSLAEGISLAIYEGMLMGLPVIGTNVDGTPEVVKPGETGWIVPVRDSRALSAAMDIATDRPDLRKAYGANAKRLIKTRYSLDMAGNTLQDVYDHVISNAG